jgi:hypothetical protein
MTPERARVVSFMFAIAWSQPFFLGNAAQPQPASIEIAFVANAEAGTVALFDVASRFILGTIDVNPAHAKREGPGKPNYAQDTDVSPGEGTGTPNPTLGPAPSSETAAARRSAHGAA